MEYQGLRISTIASKTALVKSLEICPEDLTIKFLSAVKILVGRMLEATGREPAIKSSLPRGMAKISFGEFWDVIWHNTISSPGKSANTRAGRRLLPDKSEKGKGMTTTWPFTNFSMPRLLSQ